jgi:hypothetical protein
MPCSFMQGDRGDLVLQEEDVTLEDGVCCSLHVGAAQEQVGARCDHNAVLSVAGDADRRYARCDPVNDGKVISEDAVAIEVGDCGATNIVVAYLRHHVHFRSHQACHDSLSKGRFQARRGSKARF